jgi:hypothetical protein
VEAIVPYLVVLEAAREIFPVAAQQDLGDFGR